MFLDGSLPLSRHDGKGSQADTTIPQQSSEDQILDLGGQVAPGCLVGHVASAEVLVGTVVGRGRGILFRVLKGLGDLSGWTDSETGDVAL